jgi:hypothetical protein
MANITHTSIDPATGHSLAHYESGVIRDTVTARLIAGPLDPALNPVIANPRAMHQRHREQNEAAAWDEANQRVQKLIEEGKLEGINTNNLGTLAVRALMRDAIDGVLINAKSGREKEAYYGLILKLLGLGGPRLEVDSTVTHTTDEATREAIAELSRILEEVHNRKPPEALEGQVRDAG